MKKILLPLTVALGVFTASAQADQKTLDAIVASGVALSNEQLEAFPKDQCESAGGVSKSCERLVEELAKLIGEFSGDDLAIESILSSVAEVHPSLFDMVGQASLGTVSGDSGGLIAQLMIELAPTAAGPNPPGLDIARAVAAPNNNIPLSVGGGGASSPN